MHKRNHDIDRRARRLAQGKRGQGPVVYWMSRDQRVADNWALLWAQQEAVIRQKGLHVVFCLIPNYLGATTQHYAFMLKGLNELHKKLDSYNINFEILEQSPEKILPIFTRTIDAHVLVSDFDPLRIKQQWKKHLIGDLVVPFYEVDSHNVIPVWATSDKKEYAAYTIRPKIHRLLDDYLTDIPNIQQHPFRCDATFNTTTHHNTISIPSLENTKNTSIQSGETAAQMAMTEAIDTTLKKYSAHRNNPCANGQSGLSPYLHFGQLAAQRLALSISNSTLSPKTKEAFLEELIVRRELADNFCYYEPQYDTFSGFPDWARKTLDEHRKDEREYIYSLEELESGKTHESLWNACQTDLVHNGKLHGYLRMYWAKNTRMDE